MTADPSPARVAADRGRSERREADENAQRRAQDAAVTVETVPPVPAPTLDGQTGTQGRELHRVTWDEGHPTFHCDAGPDANCRNYPSCECEVWHVDTVDVDGRKVHAHPDVPQETCWELTWLTACDAEDTYCGDEPMPRRDGPIDTEWEGECLLWEYAEPSS